MPGEQDELRITVSLVDNASAGLAAMRREVKGLGEDTGKQLAPLKGAFEGVSKSIKEVTGGHAAAQMKSFKRSQIDMAGKIKEVTNVTMGGEKALLGFIGRFGVAGAAVASFGTLAAAAIASNKEWANSLVEMKKQADLLGVDPANLKAMKKYAEEAHVPLEDVTKIMRAQSEVTAGLKDPTSEMYKRLRELTSDPRYFKSFEKFQEAWQAADDPMKRALVLQNAVQSMGESAAQEETQRQQREIAAGRQRKINEQQINDERKAGEHIAEQALGVPETILLLPKTMEAASEAAKKSMAEAQKAAADIDKQFIRMKESMTAFFNTFELGISGPVLKAVTQVADAMESLRRWQIRTSGSAAEKALLEEQEGKRAPGGGSFAVQPVYVRNTAGERLEDVNRQQQQEQQQPYGYPQGEGGATLFKQRGTYGGTVRFALPGETAEPGMGFMGSPGNIMPSMRDRPIPPMSQQAPPGLGYTPPPGEPTFATFSRDALDSNTEQLKHVTDELSALTQALRPGGPQAPLPGAGALPPPQQPLQPQPPAPQQPPGKQGKSWLDTISESIISPAGADELKDHQKELGGNTQQLKTLNEKLSQLSQLTQQLEPDGRPTAAAAVGVERKAELALPDPGYVPPMRAAAAPAEHVIRLADRGPNNASVLRRHIGQQQFERATDDIDRDEVGAGSVLRRDDRSELDRRVMDFMKPLQVEGNATLTADIRAPAGTRVGVEARGLFKKTLLYRQTQMALAATGPPNPAYSPTLEDFPL